MTTVDDEHGVAQVGRLLAVDLRPTRVDARTRSLVENACLRLSDARESRFRPVRRFWRRLHLGAVESLRFVRVRDWTRPPRDEIVVVDPCSDRAYLPSVAPDDFFAVAKLLNLSTLLGKAVLEAFVRVEPGVFLRRCPPKQIADEVTARALGVPITEFERVASAKWESLWWQCWEGYLYRLTLDEGASPAILKRVDLQYGVGPFRMLRKEEVGPCPL